MFHHPSRRCAWYRPQRNSSCTYIVSSPHLVYLQVVLEKSNSRTWSNSSSSVQGGTASINLKNDTGGPISLDNLDAPLEVWLTRGTDEVDLSTITVIHNHTKPRVEPMIVHVVCKCTYYSRDICRSSKISKALYNVCCKLELSFFGIAVVIFIAIVARVIVSTHTWHGNAYFFKLVNWCSRGFICFDSFYWQIKCEFFSQNLGIFSYGEKQRPVPTE